MPRGILFDRDGTLILDVPYNGDPELVVPLPSAAEAVAVARSAGIMVGLATNQSGIGKGLITADQARSVNQRVDSLLGPFDGTFMCPHTPADNCACRKPQPGLVLAAAHAWGIDPSQLAVIGDIGADVGAATAAGARTVLVPQPSTRAQEIAAAPVVAPDLMRALVALGVPVDVVDTATLAPLRATSTTNKETSCTLR